MNKARGGVANKSYIFAYLLIILGSFIIILWNILVRRQFFDDIDGYNLYEEALILLQGEIGSFWRVQKAPPGYPALLIFFNLFTRNYFRAAQLVAAVFGTLYIVSTMAIIYRISKSHVFAYIVGINTLCSIVIWASLEFITDLPFGFFFQSCIYYIITGEENFALQLGNTPNEWDKNSLLRKIFSPTNRFYVYAGLCGGAACLIRWTGMLLLPISIVIICIRPFMAEKQLMMRIKTTLKRLFTPKLLVFLLAFFFIWSFWLIPNWYYFGSPFYSIIYLEIVRWGSIYRPLGIDASQFDNMFEIIMYDPGLFIRNMLTTFGIATAYFINKIFIGPRLVVDWGMGPALIIFLINLVIAILGIIPYFKKVADQKKSNQNSNDPADLDNNRFNMIAIIIAILLYFMVISISHFLPRFAFPVLPIGFFFFLRGLVEIGRRIKIKLLANNSAKSQKISVLIQQPSIRNSILALSICCLFLGSVWGSVYDWRDGQEVDLHDSVELVIVSDYLKAHTDSMNICFPRDNYWYYYSNGHISSGEFGNFPRSPEALAALTADYMSFAVGYESNHMPEMVFLFDPDDPRIPANFELVYYNESISGYPGKIIVIYQIHH